MTITYLVAVAFATLIAYLEIRDPRMAYWWRWEKVALARPIAELWAIFVACALGVTAIFEHLHWRALTGGTGSAVGNGVLDGSVTFLMLRFGAFGIGHPRLAPARLFVDWEMRRFGRRLDEAAEWGVKRQVGDLQPGGLCRASLQTFWRHVAPELRRSDVASAHLEELMDRHVEVLSEDELVDADEAASQILAAEFLRYIVEGLVVANRDATIELGEDETGQNVP